MKAEIKHMRLITLLTLLAALGIASLSASPYLSFKRYQVEDGLSHNTVWCAMQDSYGFIWLGTSDGLNCYNGRSNKVYRNVLNDKYSLENNFVQALFEEENHTIWVGTNWGLYMYDRKSEHFTYFEKRTDYGVLISSEVKKIIKTHNGLIWIATLGQGLFIYDPHKDTLTQNSLNTSFIWDLCESDSRRVYASSLQEDLLCFDEKGNFLQTYSPLSGINRAGNTQISCVQNIGGAIWVGADNNILCCLNERTGQVDSYNAAPLNFGTIRCLLNYSGTSLLMGTDNGLYRFDRSDKTFMRLDNPSDARALSDQSVNALMKDAEGGVWVLTNLGGVNYITKQTKHFDCYSSVYQNGKSDSGIVVGPFCEDSSGNIWIGTRNGLYLFDTTTLQFTNYPIAEKAGSKYDIRALLLDGERLWIGTGGGGLKVFDTRTKEVKEYNHSRNVLNTICSDDVLAICKDHNGDIFVGTSWGLCRYNAREDHFTVVNAIGTMISVVDLLEDMYGNLWVATSNSGVFRYHISSGEWKHFEHRRADTTTITNNFVIALFEDLKGTMWFGTNGGGLCSFSSDTDTFVDFDPQNKLLPSKVIYSIQQDRVGDFWLSTNAGLFKINPNNKEHFRRFTANDGLQGNQFNAQSSLKASDGKLYFGGINGFNSFTPELFADNDYIPPVYVTDIHFPYTTDNQIAQNLLQLKEPLYMSREITLPYEYNSFSLSFVALSYEDPGKNGYSYILKGVDKEWVVNSKTNTASYTNLPPGEYEFLVRGSNNDNKWNTKATSLTIIITPPWWRTVWAYSIYVLCLLGAAIYIGFRWDKYVKSRYKRRMEEYEIRKEKEIYESKIGFFINLVHEIRTPLSLIRLPLEKLLEEKRGENRDSRYLSVIDKNVTYLLGITNQLLDFQKMENGGLQLNLKSCNVSHLISDVYNQFMSPAELKGILLTLNIPATDVYASVDKEMIYKIIVNLMGNAVKFANNRIEIALLLVEDTFEILIHDDGPGIPDAEKQKIFAAFYQVEATQSGSGTGIGLAFSKSLAEAHHGVLRVENSAYGGSSFILSLPLGNVEAAKECELIQEESASTASEQDADNPYSGRRFTVLLVEDNLELLNLTKESLSASFRVVKAQNGRQALDVLMRESVDVIVSDVMMLEMDGLELTKIVKSNIDYSHIPIILLTAKTTLESKIEGFECGADAYIEKPFSIRQLRMQIENLLKLRLAFHKLMAELSGSVSTSEFALSQKDCEFVAKIQEVVADQLSDENFSIDNLAEMMHMSRSNFYRKIKALSGMAPNDYLKMLRLNKAAELIKSGIRIAEVCERVGFTSSSYFAKCFKAQFGVLPRDYRG